MRKVSRVLGPRRGIRIELYTKFLTVRFMPMFFFWISRKARTVLAADTLRRSLFFLTKIARLRRSTSIDQRRFLSRPFRILRDAARWMTAAARRWSEFMLVREFSSASPHKPAPLASTASTDHLRVCSACSAATIGDSPAVLSYRAAALAILDCSSAAFSSRRSLRSSWCSRKRTAFPSLFCRSSVRVAARCSSRASYVMLCASLRFSTMKFFRSSCPSERDLPAFRFGAGRERVSMLD